MFRRGWWQTPPPHHLTYIFNPVPNRVNQAPLNCLKFLIKLFSSASSIFTFSLFSLFVWFYLKFSLLFVQNGDFVRYFHFFYFWIKVRVARYDFISWGHNIQSTVTQNLESCCEGGGSMTNCAFISAGLITHFNKQINKYKGIGNEFCESTM